MDLKELLNKLKWHPEYDFNKVIIWYISRGKPNDIDYLKGDEIIKLNKYYIETEKACIPYHRIIKIEYEGKIIFQK